MNSLTKKIFSASAITLIIAGFSYFALAQFVEPGSAPADSNQDFAQNILGANNSNNDFDSSAVAVNKNGSIIEMLEYLSGKASSSQYFVGGNDYFCKIRSVDNTGFTSIENINNGNPCDSQKECASGDCLTSGGYACAADADCADANCDTDYDTVTKYCHVTSTSCVNGPGENVYDDGYELCSGDSFYKSCSSSAWGSEQYPADSYCDAGDGAQSGYSASTTKSCVSGSTGGFDSGTCTSCSPYQANTVASCKTSCTGDGDCWTGSVCLSNECVTPCGASTACGTTCTYSGVEYGTVDINGQCWFTNNLNIGTKLANYSTMPSNDSATEKWCYNDSDSNCDTYGGLYTWPEAMNLGVYYINHTYSATNPHQGICPSGWHIPSDPEWYALENFLKTGTCNAARSNAYDCDPAGTKMSLYTLNGTNSSGFSGLLAGYRGSASYAYGPGAATDKWGVFYSTTEAAASNGWYRRIDSSRSTVYRYADKDFGFSVRCLKD